MKIYFTAIGRFLSAGIYDFKTHEIQISVPRAKDINRLLVHETHHAVEGMLGQITSVDRLVNYIFNVGVYTGTAILALAAACSLFINASQPENFLHLTFGLGAVLFLIGGIAYIANPAERRAYRVRTPPIPFVRVVKRPLRQQFVGLGQMLIAFVLRKTGFHRAQTDD